MNLINVCDFNIELDHLKWVLNFRSVILSSIFIDNGLVYIYISQVFPKIKMTCISNLQYHVIFLLGEHLQMLKFKIYFRQL